MKKTTIKKRPINQIKISGTEILNIDLNQGWEITNFEYDDTCPPNWIDSLVVMFEKKRRGENKMNENISTTTPNINQITIGQQKRIENYIKQLPSAEPEIIYCKDCKHHWTYKSMDRMPIERCDLEQIFYDAEHDFCSLAERREVTT